MILLALKDREFRAGHASSLAAGGHLVSEVVSTDEVLSALDSRSDIRLLVVEPEMPGCLDGFDLVRFVARRWPDIPVILIGWPGGAMPSFAGRVAFLPSACAPSVLMQRVRELLAT